MRTDLTFHGKCLALGGGYYFVRFMRFYCLGSFPCCHAAPGPDPAGMRVCRGPFPAPRRRHRGSGLFVMQGWNIRHGTNVPSQPLHLLRLFLGYPSPHLFSWYPSTPTSRPLLPPFPALFLTDLSVLQTISRLGLKVALVVFLLEASPSCSLAFP